MELRTYRSKCSASVSGTPATIGMGSLPFRTPAELKMLVEVDA